MTYLELVNGVLSRMREDVVTTVQGTDDVVVQLVKSFVNDAKRTVENSHTWNSLSVEWSFDTVVGQDKYTLTGTSRSCIIEYIYDDAGNPLRITNRAHLRSKALSGAALNTSRYYILDGEDANGNVNIRVWPAPEKATTYHAFGFQPTADLSNDTDKLKVPAMPVLYLAQALAARERGEVGGQTPQELVLLAERTLRDEIGKDAVNSEPENIWIPV